MRWAAWGGQLGVRMGMRTGLFWGFIPWCPPQVKIVVRAQNRQRHTYIYIHRGMYMHTHALGTHVYKMWHASPRSCVFLGTVACD